MREVSTISLGLLKKELDSIKEVITKLDNDIAQLDKNIGDLENNKLSLTLVASAIEKEMDRLRQQPVQLEFELVSDE